MVEHTCNTSRSLMPFAYFETPCRKPYPPSSQSPAIKPCECYDQ